MVLDWLIEWTEPTEWTDGVRWALGLARFGIHISLQLSKQTGGVRFISSGSKARYDPHSKIRYKLVESEENA